MQISVIIPTRNHAPLLEKTLASLARQQYPVERFEIIVVDNGSSDTTSAVCEVWRTRIPNLRRVFEPNPGLHVGRHLGLRLAQGDILVYADDDIQAEPSWLGSVAEAFEDPEVGLVGGNNLPDYESAPPAWLEGLKRRFPFGWAIPPLSILDFGAEPRDIDPHYVWGCNYSIRKNLLLDIGGFHPDGMPADLQHLRGDGESYVSNQVALRGKRVRFAPGATVHHFTPTSRMTLDYLHDRGIRQGISKSYTVIRRAGGISYVAAITLKMIVAKSRITSLKSLNEGSRALWDGYAEGIQQHIRHCRKHPDTIEWILRTDYMDS